MQKKKNNLKKENIKKNKELDVVFLLDRSGSMQGSEQDTIGGYNSYLDKQRKNKYNTKITTVLFDDKYEVVHNRKDIKEIKNLTEKEYYVRGCTALLDAIGKTINNLDKKVKDNKVLFVITTDGLENASKEYSKDKIKALIEQHPNWEFIYIGANIDSYSEGTSLGIERKNISNYSKSKKGTDMLFRSINYLSDCMCMNEEITETWKEKLENTN